MAEYMNKDVFLSSMGLTGDETKYGNRDAEHQHRSYSTYMSYEIMDCVEDSIVEEELAPVRHGRWIGICETEDDAYLHHKCSICNVYAPFDYKYREDWDEGMDGEWYFLVLVDDGINEHLTPYCPNCGAKMDLEARDV